MHAAAFRASRSSDAFGRYYTSESTSHAVVASIPSRRPSLVLDLGSGDGALSSAAIARWGRASIVSIDNDPRAREVAKANFVRADVLSPDLPSRAGLQLGSVSAAVCNPPFIRPKWRKQFAELLEDVRLSGCYSAVEEAGAAVLFLAQNLRFLRRSGHLAVIVPDGIVSGARHRRLRESLLEMHNLREAIELPSGTFKRTEVRTHLLVIQKGFSSAEPIQLRRLCRQGLTEPVLLDHAEAAGRMDYSFHSAKVRDPRPADVVLLGDVADVITRGRRTSAERLNLKRQIFHTTDFPSGPTFYPLTPWIWNKSDLRNDPKEVLAVAGDILISRVGRRLEDKVALLERGPIAITDCVYKISLPAAYRLQVLHFLRSKDGRTELAARAQGTAAKHLSIMELRCLQLPFLKI